MTAGEEEDEKSKRTEMTVLSWWPRDYSCEWMAIGISQRKFRAFLEFRNVVLPRMADENKDDDGDDDMMEEMIVSIPNNNDDDAAAAAAVGIKTDTSYNNNNNGVQVLSWEESVALRRKFCDLWKAQRLVTTDTRWVKERQRRDTSSTSTFIKQGSFEEKLLFQIERFEEIVRFDKDNQSLLTWLQENYGHQETLQLQPDQLYALSADQQKQVLQQFMDWFRATFPYYYDRCFHCNASHKEDPDKQATPQTTYVGQVYPSPEELQRGKASRVELYQCHQCHDCWQFPRFNAPWSIIQTKRGRCGEYSILLYRMFRDLGHANTLRYVVDWADHVWIEVARSRHLPTPPSPDDDKDEPQQQQQQDCDMYDWIHLDPCEAAVDNPLLYQSWGKKATYVMALYAPSTNGNDENDHNHKTSPLVEDVTHRYTSDSLDVIGQRRHDQDGETEETIHQAIEFCNALLQSKLEFMDG
jgi:hypothetical protein